MRSDVTRRPAGGFAEWRVESGTFKGLWRLRHGGCDPHVGVVIFDLHTHTTASDGSLVPAELLERAVERGLEAIAITDHDTMAGYVDLAVPAGLRLIPGIELSTCWHRTGVHVLGLNVDPASAALAAAVESQGQARWERAERIAEKLRPMCGEDPMPMVSELSGNDCVGRPHFARYLVAAGIVPDEGTAFQRYLGAGKIGDVRQQWASMEQVIDWIRGAGGIAVLAHPSKYGFTASRLRRLVADFQSLGGQGLEVISGQQNADVTRFLGRLCKETSMLASNGSDFHRPDVPWSELGAFPALPRSVRPVWEAF